MAADLIITHNAGFFACCSNALINIIFFYNKKGRLPIVDRSKQFKFFKLYPEQDLSNVIFKKKKIAALEGQIKYKTEFFPHAAFSPYKEISFKKLKPFLDFYFSPAEIVLKKEREIKSRINEDYENICAICFRGNDQRAETKIAPYEEFIKQAEEIRLKNPKVKFYIQTDEKPFLKEFISHFDNCFYLEEMPMTEKSRRTVMHFEVKEHSQEKFDFTVNFFASVIFMSKCKYLITYSGFFGLWIALYRGSFFNAKQYLDGEWV